MPLGYQPRNRSKQQEKNPNLNQSQPPSYNGMYQKTGLPLPDPPPTANPTSSSFPVPNVTRVLTCQNTRKQKKKKEKNSKAEHGPTREETLSQGAVCTRSTETRPDPGGGEEPNIMDLPPHRGRAGPEPGQNQQLALVQRAPTEEKTLELKN